MKDEISYLKAIIKRMKPEINVN